MKHSKIIDFIVGVFVVIGILALLFLVTRVNDLDGQGSGGNYTVNASFNNIGDLKVKAPVTLAGVRIGRVSNIVIDKEEYSAIVEMDIDSHYDNLPTDSSVAILTAGLLGSKYIGIEPGAEEEYLEEGSEIEIAQSAIVLENLIGQFLSSGAGIKD